MGTSPLSHERKLSKVEKTYHAILFAYAFAACAFLIRSVKKLTTCVSTLHGDWPPVKGVQETRVNHTSVILNETKVL